MAEVRGFLPPEPPHTVQYRYVEGNGVHRLPSTVIHGPESVILTADEDALRELERLGLHEVPQEWAEGWLSAWQDGEDISEDVEAYREEDEPESPEEESSPEESSEEPEEAADEQPPIPDERPEEYADLQDLAAGYDDISGNQSGDEIWEALQEKRDQGDEQ